MITVLPESAWNLTQAIAPKGKCKSYFEPFITDIVSAVTISPRSRFSMERLEEPLYYLCQYQLGVKTHLRKVILSGG